MGSTVSQPQLRMLGIEDVDRLVELESANRDRPWSRGVFADELRSGNRVYMAILDGEQLFGFGGVMITDEEAHITNLLVAPDQRRKGFARALLIALIRESIEKGAKHVTLEVRSRNQGAIDLYRQFGMSPVGVRKGYYVDDDALILWAYDIDGAEYARRLEEME